MIEFGKSLRDAREAKDMTVAQVAESTHLAPRTIEELEAEDFSHIVAPIYGRGFVKLYCEAVGLEFKPFVDEFMEIYNGARETGIKERPLPMPVETPDREEPAAASESAPEAPATETLLPPVPPPQAELFQETDEPHAVPENDTPNSDPSFSRYATPIRSSEASGLPSPWRIGTLALVGLAILLILVLAIRALYRATSDAPTPPVKQDVAAVPAPAAVKVPLKSPSADNKGKNAPRVQQKIPSLYID